MSDHSPSAAFHTANPHALATILEASETRSIIAASDIFDINGMKLWARNQPVSQELQRKLMDRSLQKPLETCLLAEDGVTPQSLKDAVQTLIDHEGVLTPLLRPHAHILRKRFDILGTGIVNDAAGGRLALPGWHIIGHDRTHHRIGGTAAHLVGHLRRIAGGKGQRSQDEGNRAHQNFRSAGAIFFRLMPPSASDVRGAVCTGR